MPLISQVGKKKWKLRLLVIGITSFLWLGVAIHLFPVYWMVTGSLKSRQEIFMFPPTLFPHQPLWDIYILLFKGITGGTFFLHPLSVYIKNSAILCTGVMLTQIPISALAAYALSKLHSAKWNRVLFLFFIGTMFVPTEISLIASYLVLRNFPFFFESSLPQINFINTYWAVILPSMAGAFSILLFKGHFDSIPDELINAARLDGASEISILRRIILPISKPVFAVVGYFTFCGIWNSFMWPLIVLRNERLFPLAVQIYIFMMQSVEGSPIYASDPRFMYWGWNTMMALSVIESIPVFIAFIIFRESLMKGIKLRGFK